MSALLHAGDEGTLESVGYPFAAPVERSCLHTLRTANTAGARVELALADLVLQQQQANASAGAAASSSSSALGAIATGGMRLSRRARVAWLSRLLRNCSDMLLVLYTRLLLQTLCVSFSKLFWSALLHYNTSI